MTQKTAPRRAIGKLFGEFVVVVFGILVALGVDDWRSSVADREWERHLLEGIATDLGNDLGDLGAAIRGARVRAAAVDVLLFSVNDVDAGDVSRSMGDELQVVLDRAVEEVSVLTTESALPALGNQFRFDVSDASFTEAVASGRFGVVQDVALRSTISRYYTLARSFGQTPDERVEAAAERFRAILADAGFAVTGAHDALDLEVALRTDRRIVAELKNMREMALRQISFHERVRDEARRIRDQLDSETAR